MGQRNRKRETGGLPSGPYGSERGQEGFPHEALPGVGGGRQTKERGADNLQVEKTKKTTSGKTCHARKSRRKSDSKKANSSEAQKGATDLCKRKREKG